MAKKFIEGEYTPEQIKSMLANSCDSSEETKYWVDLTEQDLIEKHQELSRNLIQLNEIEEEAKAIADNYKQQMKPMKVLQKDLLGAIGVKKELVTGTLYHLANQDDGMMETYTQTGELYASRRLKPEERQMRAAFPLNKAVGED